METAWSGFGIPTDNLIDTEVFQAKTLPIILSNMPGVYTYVTLPLTTHAVKMLASGGSVWYTVPSTDTPVPPGPIPGPALSQTIPDSAFVLGDVLLPDRQQIAALQLDSLQHVLILVSDSPSVSVLITPLVETP
jgi:hypothetical protein